MFPPSLEPLYICVQHFCKRVFSTQASSFCVHCLVWTAFSSSIYILRSYVALTCSRSGYFPNYQIIEGPWQTHGAYPPCMIGSPDLLSLQGSNIFQNLPIFQIPYQLTAFMTEPDFSLPIPLSILCPSVLLLFLLQLLL